MKKHATKALAFAIVLILLLQTSMIVFASLDELVESETSYPLITHWDFEGATSAIRLSDKATGGKTPDALTRNGTVLFSHVDPEDDTTPWVITVDADGGEYLSATAANATDDLYDMANKTIVIKAKLENDGTRTSIAGIAGKKGAFELAVATTNITKSYAYYDSGTRNFCADSTQTVPFGEENDNYRVYILSFESTVDADNNETVVTKTYVSTSSNPQSTTDFILYSEATSDNAKSFTNSSLSGVENFILGKRPTDLSTNRKLKITYDDVKIYDGVMTPAQVATEGKAPAFRGAQIAMGSSETGAVTPEGTFGVRLVGTVNTASITTLGYNVTATYAGGTKDLSDTVNHLYGAINADTKNGHKEYGARTDFQSNYLFALSLTHIPLELITADGGYVELEVTPYADGYTGDTYTLRITYDSTQQEPIDRYVVTFID